MTCCKTHKDAAALEKREFLYEGKAKKLYSTDDPNLVIVEYKDHLTAFNAQKKATMGGKGRLNNLISSHMFGVLAKRGVENHFVAKIDDTHQVVQKVTIVPLEVIIRNITTGSICKRFGVAEGMTLPHPLLEFCYKDDELGDPFVTEDHIILFKWGTREQIDAIKEISFKVNEVLRAFFDSLKIILVDFKLEFGVTRDGKLILADEISPDTCRFWDKSSLDKLDKDRFRKDLGDVLRAYEEIYDRIKDTD